MLVDLIIDGELVEEEAICTAIEDIIPKDGEQLQTNFDCKIENVDKAENCTGLEIISSGDICNIPTTPELINPAIVDELIEAEEIIDYKNVSINIPVFNATLIETTNFSVLASRTGFISVIARRNT